MVTDYNECMFIKELTSYQVTSLVDLNIGNSRPSTDEDDNVLC